MTRAWRAIAAIAVFATLCGCGPPDHRVTWEGGANRTETIDLVRLHQVRDVIDSAWEKSQLERLSAALEEDVVFVPPHDRAVEGRAAALAWVSASTAGRQIRDTYVTESLHLESDWALETWAIDRRVREEGGTHRLRLKGIHLFRRQRDGRWLLAHRIWNESPEHTQTKGSKASSTAGI